VKDIVLVFVGFTSDGGFVFLCALFLSSFPGGSRGCVFVCFHMLFTNFPFTGYPSLFVCSSCEGEYTSSADTVLLLGKKGAGP
jgi:hypothetical protein